jgi:hypothetical protein
VRETIGWIARLMKGPEEQIETHTVNIIRVEWEKQRVPTPFAERNTTDPTWRIFESLVK